ncbi:MAG: hypothetical protein AAGC71_06575 [Pseudomonadota bacterium]
MTNSVTISLEQHREAFAQRRFLAMPLAGTVMWALIGIAGAIAPTFYKVMAVWIGAGCIFYLGMLLSRFTGEDFFGKNRPANPFDRLFMSTVAMALLVFAIAMPFASVDYTSVPMSVGILTGLMWLPFGWIINHWVGAFHAITRTVLIVGAWFAFPDHRFVTIPAIIVVVYVVTIVALERRSAVSG